ncbi:MAG: FAD-dependent oxidoreductase, partial [Candidatus Eremiobacterota bacterium]
MANIGVFVCWCGSNIAQTVDVGAVAKAAGEFKDVVYAVDYKYMCSSPGQNLMIDAIKTHNLDGVVIASCSPRMHESTFRSAAVLAGFNPYMVEMANLREHCSWVHDNREEATKKAIELVRMLVAKVARNAPLNKIHVPVTRRALVIGGGIAGIQAALDIANGGVEVIMVEKEPSIGGHMSQLDETFPTLDCSQCILTPRMVEVATHKNITLYAYSEVDSVQGFVGNFKVKIRRKS